MLQAGLELKVEAFGLLPWPCPAPPALAHPLFAHPLSPARPRFDRPRRLLADKLSASWPCPPDLAHPLSTRFRPLDRDSIGQDVCSRPIDLPTHLTAWMSAPPAVASLRLTHCPGRLQDAAVSELADAKEEIEMLQGGIEALKAKLAV